MPENKIIIKDGVVKVPGNSTFADSISTAGLVLNKGVTHYGLSLNDTVKMMSETPAKILGIKNLGKIQTGYIADLVLDACYHNMETDMIQEAVSRGYIAARFNRLEVANDMKECREGGLYSVYPDI